MNLSMQELQEQLNKANNPQPKHDFNSLINEAYMQIGNGEIFHHMISCQKLIVEDKVHYFLIAYDKGCPPLTVDCDLDKGVYTYGRWEKVGERIYSLFKEAIEERGKHKHLDNYTFMIAFLLGKYGLDVQEFYVMQERGAE